MLAIVLVVQLVVSSITQGIPTLAPWIRADLGLSYAQVALFGMAINLATAALIPAAGWVVDAYGEKAAHVAGGLTVGVAAAAFAFTPFGILAFLPLLVVGIGAATPTPGGSRAVMGWFPPGQRGVAMGIRQTGIALGGAAAAAFAPALAETAGWRTAVVAGAVACVVMGLVCWMLYREPADRHRASRRPSLPGLAAVRELVTRDVAILAVAGGLLPFGQFAVITFLALYLQQTHGVPVTTGARLLLAAQLAGVAGRVVWGLGSDRAFGGRRRPPLISAGLLAAGLTLVLGWLPPGIPFAVLVVLALVLGFNAIGWQGNWVALVSELARPGQQGRTIGLAMVGTFVGVAVGPPIAGFIVDHTGSWPAAWTVVAVILATGALLVMPVREATRPLAPARQAA